MYTLYKFHFLNGISEISKLFYDILIIWPAPVFLKKGDVMNGNCVITPYLLMALSIWKMCCEHNMWNGREAVQ